MRQYATTMLSWIEHHLAKVHAVDTGDSVMPGQSAVEHREFRVHYVCHAQVVFQQFLEEQMRFAQHRPMQQFVVFRIKNFVRYGRIYVPQAEPLAGEILGERTGSGVAEHPFDLGSQFRRFAQFAPGRQRQQRLVRHGAPQKVGKPGGECIVVQRPFSLTQIQKLRRREHGFDPDPHRDFKRQFLLKRLGDERHKRF